MIRPAFQGLQGLGTGLEETRNTLSGGTARCLSDCRHPRLCRDTPGPAPAASSPSGRPEALPLGGEESSFAEAAMASNAQKSDESGSKRQRMENEAPENPQLSFPDKTDLALSEDSQSLYDTEPLEKVLNDMNKEIMTLLSKYANIIRQVNFVLFVQLLSKFSRFFHLSETAAMEASCVQELEGILKEARDIDEDLKQKRESLKQRFTVMANTLQG
ncbi:testis-expressed protein 12 isoform X1 [Pipra filicauda]|uniref:Testis-expressed protein 12 isoform X1 n=1 Tax=Pipra filicauda TaxID=649802 RepID=A0A6J2HS46_9PASS|nr:testis-expressed protein 12 isoform X1 [Pipra filicauda]